MKEISGQAVAPNRSRLDYVDTARFLGMFLVVFCHAIGRDSRFNASIYVFHLPLFFVLNGITLKIDLSKPFGIFLEKKVKSYVVPVICLGFIEILLDAMVIPMVGRTVAPQFVGNMFIDLLGQQRVYTIWFMGALFFADIFFFFIVKLGKNKIGLMSLLVGAVLFLAIYFNKYYGNRNFVWNIDVSLFGVLFVFEGYLFSHSKFEQIKQFLLSNRLISLCFGLVIFYLGFVLGQINFIKYHFHLEMWARIYKEYYLALPAGILCCLGAVLISNSVRNKVFSILGKATITVFAFHQMSTIPIFNELVAKDWWVRVSAVSGWANGDLLLFTLCSTLFSFALLLPWFYLFKYSPLSFMVNQKLPQFYKNFYIEIKKIFKSSDKNAE